MADLEIDSNLSGTVGTSVSGSFGAVGPVTLSGIPDRYTINVPEIRVREIDKIEIGVDPLESTVKLEPIQLNLGPIQTSLAITQIPSVRTHLPMNYCVGFSLMGMEVAAVKLCGEGMVITEPYRPNPCEQCGTSRGNASFDAESQRSSKVK